MNLFNININIRDYFNIDYLGEDLQLPDSKRLRESLEFIKEICDLEVQKRKKYVRDEFLATKYQELIKFEGNVKEIKRILNEIVNFKD